MKKYEALFIFVNTATDEELDSKIGQIGSEISKLGGKLQSATRMGRIPFARPILKKDAGAYVQILFEMDPAKINSLHERYRHKEDLVRLQIVAAKASTAKSASAAGKEDAGTSARRSAAGATKQSEA